MLSKNQRKAAEPVLGHKRSEKYAHWSGVPLKFSNIQHSDQN